MSDTDHKPAPDEFFLLWVLIAQTKDAVSRAREREYSRFGLNNERRAILYMLDNNGGHATPVDIARELFRELHSVTGMIKRMEDAGLVSRHKGTGRSKVEVRLTDHGREVLDASRGTEIDKKIFSVLTKRERERFGAYLWKVRGSVLKDLGIPEWQLNLSLHRDREDDPGGEA
jgi:DNA-binding MarR family transcriptional regulator